MSARNDLRGPSQYAISVMRSIINRPKTVYAIAIETGLSERTVKAQIDALRKSDAVKVHKFIPSHHKQGGPLAVYQPIIVEIA